MCHGQLSTITSIKFYRSSPLLLIKNENNNFFRSIYLGLMLLMHEWSLHDERWWSSACMARGYHSLLSCSLHQIKGPVINIMIVGIMELNNSYRNYNITTCDKGWPYMQTDQSHDCNESWHVLTLDPCESDMCRLSPMPTHIATLHACTHTNTTFAAILYS